MMYCDVCGTKFAEGYLRPNSKFCLTCGEELSRPVLNSLKRKASEPPPQPSRVASVSVEVVSEPREAITNDDDIYGEQLPTPSRREIITRSRPTGNRPRVQEPAEDTESEYERDQESESSESEYEEPPTPTPRRRRLLTPLEVPRPETPRNLDAEEISLDILSYGLGPPIEVAHRYRQGFARKTISQVLGGSVQQTYCKMRGCESMYVCYRIDWNDLSPSKPGMHGMYITRAIPSELCLENFTVFAREYYNPVWHYLGQYRIPQTSYVSKRQWATLPERWRDKRCKVSTGGSGYFGRELRRLGLGVGYNDVKEAFEKGIIKWQVNVLECIGFDVELYQRLMKSAGRTTTKKRKVDSEDDGEADVLYP